MKMEIELDDKLCDVITDISRIKNMSKSEIVESLILKAIGMDKEREE